MAENNPGEPRPPGGIHYHVVLLQRGDKINWHIELRADAMFYDAACGELQRAKDATCGVEPEQKAVAQVAEEMELIQSREDWINDRELSNRFERLAISMESLECSLSAAFGPQLQSLAMVHLHSAASLEAHINSRGETRLPGRERNAFERCTLDGKWMFLPRLVNYLAGITVVILCPVR